VDSASKRQGTLPVAGGHCGEIAFRKDNRQGICYDSLVVHNKNNGLIFSDMAFLPKHRSKVPRLLLHSLRMLISRSFVSRGFAM
jgi:hypothetical protein